MQINREKLLGVLTAVQPGLASKEIIQQSTCFIFRKKKVMTYNDEIAVCHPAKLSIEGAVDAQSLYKLLNKTKEEELDIDVDGSELLVKGIKRKSKAGLKLAEINLPFDEISKPSDWMELPGAFAEGISFCAFSAGQDMARMIMTNIHIKKNIIESCDNFRLTRFDMGKGSGKFFSNPVLIPAKNVNTILKYGPTEYCQVKGWLHFRNESKVVFSCRVMEGMDYPDTSKILNVEGERVKMPSYIQDVLEKAGVFTNADLPQDEFVKITVSKGQMIIRGEGETGWFEESCRVKYNGEDRNFSINPQFLHKMLGLLHELTVGKGKIKMEGENFVHIVNMAVSGKRK